MDNIEGLNRLTKDIVKKQYETLESINILRRKTDSVCSDISNLINSLQMVGNRQFAENRIQEDDRSTTIDEGLNQREYNSSINPKVPVSRDLNLSSILLRAIQLLPRDEEEIAIECNSQAKEEGEEGGTKEDGESDEKEDGREEEMEDEKEEEYKREERKVVKQSESSSVTKTQTVDRDRITDILKKYSLYDGEDDDDDVESE